MPTLKGLDQGLDEPRWRHRLQGESVHLKPSSAPWSPCALWLVSGHSYRSAATGSSRAAVHAGAKPENNPVRIDTNMLTITNPEEKCTGKEGNALLMAKQIRNAKPRPMTPPRRHKAVDSIRNCSKIVRRLASSALR